ncbi:MAG: alanine racemase [Proteobacteria bacterium]|nr:alanine racemase [Pseudomonadota bacterium]
MSTLLLRAYDQLMADIAAYRALRPCDRFYPHSSSQAIPRLVLVTKGVDVPTMQNLIMQREHRLLGENRLAELQHKAAALKAYGISWVYIGALQSKKIPKIVALCDEIQSVGSWAHLELIEKAAKAIDKHHFRVFLQVNIACEPQKSGFSADEVRRVFATITSTTFSHIYICGLMVLPPKEDAILAQRGKLPRSYQDIVKLHCECDRKELSLGMSKDWKLALDLGSTTLRIGSAVFFPDV